MRYTINFRNWASLKYIVEIKTIKKERVEQGRRLFRFCLGACIVHLLAVPSDRERHVMTPSPSLRRTVSLVCWFVGLFSWQCELVD